MFWQTSRRKLGTERPLVMGILNVTPDSFSDGGRYALLDAAIERAAQMGDEGADIIDVGGESTRPGGQPVPADDEIARVFPVISALTGRFDTPVSIDTSKSEVARAAIAAGAEIINDISGLRWDPHLAEVAAEFGTGLVLMHSRGTFSTLHSEPPATDIIDDIVADLNRSIGLALLHGVNRERIALDPGIGFGKTFEQNIEVLEKLDVIVAEFPGFPLLIGTSRKSFLGRLYGGAEPADRVSDSVRTAMDAERKGAKIFRVHDVRETVQALGSRQR